MQVAVSWLSVCFKAYRMMFVHCILTASDAVDVKVAYSCTYELRPYLDLLLQMLLLEDSWQNHRIHNALKGQLNIIPADSGHSRRILLTLDIAFTVLSYCLHRYCRLGRKSVNVNQNFSVAKIAELLRSPQVRSGVTIQNQEMTVEKEMFLGVVRKQVGICLLYTSPSPRDRQKSRMPSSA